MGNSLCPKTTKLVNNMLLRAILLASLLIFTASAANAQKPRGRAAYIMINPDKLINGEIIAVRDSFVVIAEFNAYSEEYMISHIDSLTVAKCSSINYIKINVPISSIENREKFSYIGGAVGTGIFAYRQISGGQFKPLDLLYIPIGTIAGYLLGLMFDSIKQSPATQIYPDCSQDSYELIKEYSRYPASEPRIVREAIDKLLSKHK